MIYIVVSLEFICCSLLLLLILLQCVFFALGTEGYLILLELTLAQLTEQLVNTSNHSSVQIALRSMDVVMDVLSNNSH